MMYRPWPDYNPLHWSAYDWFQFTSLSAQIVVLIVIAWMLIFWWILPGLRACFRSWLGIN